MIKKSNYYTKIELKRLGFKKIGRNIKISKKSSIYFPKDMIIGDNSRIDDFVVISGKVKIGKNVHLAPHTIVCGGNKAIIFKDFSGMAFGSKVIGVSDDYSGSSMTNPTVNKDYKKKKKQVL